MGLAEAVLATRAQTGTPERRAMQVTPWGDWGTASQSSSGVNVNADSAMQLLTVYGCVQLISDTVATLPRHVYRTSASGAREEATPPTWLEQPSPTVDMVEFIGQTLISLLLDGNAYWAYGLNPSSGTPINLNVLNPLDVQIFDEGNGPVYTVRGVPFAGRLLHIKSLTRPGCLKGLSPLEAARQSIGLGLGAQQFAGSFYTNGSTMSGVIQVPGELNKQQARDMRDGWGRDHSGSSNAHLPGVLTNGATWQQISVTPEQAQFLESRQFQAAEICSQLFLVDPAMFAIATGGTSLTYANLEQRGIHLVQFTLLRWIVRLERAFTYLLPKPLYVKLNVDALQRADLKSRYEAYRIALGPSQPFATVNEPRGLENLPPIAGGDTIDMTTTRELTEMIQKIYLGVNTVLSQDEAREILNRAGAELDLPGPMLSGPKPAVGANP